MAANPIEIAPRNDREVREAAKLYRLLVQEKAAALIGPDGTRIKLPSSVHDVLLRVLENMQAGKGVAVLPMMEELSTQAAADLIGVSRQFVVRECEAEKIPFHMAGTHRRILLRDLLDYKQRREEGRKAAIERIARQSEELGEYDQFVRPED